MRACANSQDGLVTNGSCPSMTRSSCCVRIISRTLIDMCACAAVTLAWRDTKMPATQLRQIHCRLWAARAEPREEPSTWSWLAACDRTPLDHPTASQTSMVQGLSLAPLLGNSCKDLNLFLLLPLLLTHTHQKNMSARPWRRAVLEKDYAVRLGPLCRYGRAR